MQPCGQYREKERIGGSAGKRLTIPWLAESSMTTLSLESWIILGPPAVPFSVLGSSSGKGRDAEKGLGGICPDENGVTEQATTSHPTAWRKGWHNEEKVNLRDFW